MVMMIGFDRFRFLLLLLIVLLSTVQRFTEAAPECLQRLFESKNEPSQGSNGFTLEISEIGENGEKKGGSSKDPPSGYVPGRTYAITLRGWRTQFIVQTFRGFGVTALFETNRKPAGKFDVKKNRDGRSEIRVAPNCRQAGVSHTNLRPKTEVHMLWRAPETSTDCVLIQATVIQSRHIWYMNENELTRKFCIIEGHQKIVPNDDPTAKCCACDEAEYEVEFIGIWSRETHPKDYPTLEHLTHFTDMLGASHSKNYSLWQFGAIATDGLKEIAEWGNTYTAESEMKANASEIRTIIKLKGLWYPEVQGRTKGLFRVNKYHHLISLACMFGPSPDWCVGVSAINLCLPDCSWIEERAFDLKPFDAGTDSGYTYMSPNTPTEPREPIAPITTHGDKRSPFYDEQSEEIPTMARLTFKRKGVQTAQCRSDDDYKREAFNITTTSEDEEYQDRRECTVSNWGPWSLCSATCGKGIRMRSRVYTFPVKAQMFNCHRQTTERQFCNAKQSECGADSEAFNSKCPVSGWSDWTECSVKCGKGERTRKRRLLDGADSNCNVELMSAEKCTGEDGDDCSVQANPLCQTTSWSDWSPCSASCDEGVRVRTRLFYYAEHEQECAKVKNLMEKEHCQFQSCQRLLTAYSEEICVEEMDAGQCAGTFPRYWFNAKTQRCDRFIYSGCKGNRNQFETEEACLKFCVPDYKPKVVPGDQTLRDFGEHGEGADEIDDGGPPVACELSEWQPWQPCSVTCGKGKRQRSRSINSLPKNGGAKCPSVEYLTQERHCELRPCALSSCRLGRWSQWSTCSVSCGEGYQTRRRRVYRYGMPDPDDPNCLAKELEQRICRMPCQQPFPPDFPVSR